MNTLSVSNNYLGRSSSLKDAEAQQSLEERQPTVFSKIIGLQEEVRRWLLGPIYDYHLGQRISSYQDELSSVSSPLTEGYAVNIDPKLQALFREQARAQRLAYYLRDVALSGDISSETANLSWKAWSQLSAATSHTLPVPDASPGPDGQLLYTWDKGEHHFELEIFPDRSGEFFYRNRASGKLWEADYVIEEPVPQEAKEKLRLFL